MATDAQRVIGAGVLVTIAGEERRLLLDFPALEIIEDEFGGLFDFTQALNGGFRAKHLKALRVGLLAGGAWAHVTRAEVDTLLARLLGSPDFVQQVLATIDRIKEAFDQAIPPPPRDKKASKVSARGRSSRGPASTAGPSSSSSSAPASSAA